MIYFKEHYKSEVNPAVLESTQAKIILHCRNTGERGVVSFDPTDCSTLYHLYSLDVHFGVGTPNAGSILHLRTDQGLVCQLFYVFIFSCYISFQEAQ